MKKFQRKIENFVCEHCRHNVAGDGYTNHCPQCLWSKHVDVYPGDRAETCRGLMEPVRVEGPASGYELVHQCVRCGEERRNKLNINDNLDEIVALAGSSS